MYNFKIAKQEEGGFKFELGNIVLLVDDYNLVNDKHLLVNPNKAIAYFNIENNIYGVSNQPLKYENAEAFFDAISKQYQIFTSGPNRAKNNVANLA